jgi:enoyl-CoA hydratase/carnithine racemase
MTTTQPESSPTVVPAGDSGLSVRRAKPRSRSDADSSGASSPAPPPSLAALLGAGGLRLELSGRRLDVVLASPERRNAQRPATWRALAAAGAWAADVADVVVLRGEPPTFSAGLDRRAFTPEGLPGEQGLFQLALADDDTIDATIAQYQRGFACWRDGPFVSIAAVCGHAVGAGFQLALACDLIVAADDTSFAMKEPSLGLVPDLAGTWPLVHAVGYARALEICATGRWVGAEEAASLGLVQHVVPVARLQSAVDELVAALLSAPRDAVRATKALLREAPARTPSQQQAAERRAQVDRLRALASEVVRPARGS